MTGAAPLQGVPFRTPLGETGLAPGQAERAALQALQRAQPGAALSGWVPRGIDGDTLLGEAFAAAPAPAPAEEAPAPAPPDPQPAWAALLHAPDAAIDTGSGHVLDNTNWPRLYAAKQLISQLAHRAQLSEDDELLIEGLLSFLDALQDYAADTLGVPAELVYLHRNPGHPDHDEPDAPDVPGLAPARQTYTVRCEFTERHPRLQLLRVRAATDAQAHELARAQLSARLEGRDIDWLSLTVTTEHVQADL